MGSSEATTGPSSLSILDQENGQTRRDHSLPPFPVPLQASLAEAALTSTFTGTLTRTSCLVQVYRRDLSDMRCVDSLIIPESTVLAMIIGTQACTSDKLDFCQHHAHVIRMQRGVAAKLG